MNWNKEHDSIYIVKKPPKEKVCTNYGVFLDQKITHKKKSRDSYDGKKHICLILQDRQRMKIGED